LRLGVVPATDRLRGSGTSTGRLSPAYPPNRSAHGSARGIFVSSSEADLADRQFGTSGGDDLDAGAANRISRRANRPAGISGIRRPVRELLNRPILCFLAVSGDTGVLFAGTRAWWSVRYSVWHRLWTKTLRRAFRFVFLGEAKLEGRGWVRLRDDLLVGPGDSALRLVGCAALRAADPTQGAAGGSRRPLQPRKSVFFNVLSTCVFL